MSYLTTGQAAKILNVSLTTLQKWAHSGVLTPALTTPGGHFRWDLEDLKRQLATKPPDQAMSDLPQVAAAVVTSARRVLITERPDGVPPWSFPTTEVEADETPETAAVRAVRQKIGLETQATGLIGQRSHPVTGRVLIYVAAVPTDGDDIQAIDEESVSDALWLTFAEAVDLLQGMFVPARDYLSRTLQ